MTDDEALEALPRQYAEALRLQSGGIDEAGIAERLAIPLDAVDSFLRLAHAKLDRARRRLAETPEDG